MISHYEFLLIKSLGLVITYCFSLLKKNGGLEKFVLSQKYFFDEDDLLMDSLGSLAIISSIPNDEIGQGFLLVTGGLFLFVRT